MSIFSKGSITVWWPITVLFTPTYFVRTLGPNILDEKSLFVVGTQNVDGGLPLDKRETCKQRQSTPARPRLCFLVTRAANDVHGKVERHWKSRTKNINTREQRRVNIPRLCELVPCILTLIGT